MTTTVTTLPEYRRKLATNRLGLWLFILSDAFVFAGLFVIVIILLFSPVIGYIPMPALAGLVILSGVQSLQIPQANSVWQTGRVPGVAMLLTFTLTTPPRRGQRQAGL